MHSILIYPVGSSPATMYAVSVLSKHGIPIIDHPAPEVSHLLLDSPYRDDVRTLANTLSVLPNRISIIGGNLPKSLTDSYSVMDLLKDHHYLSENAAITAECALHLAAQKCKRTFRNSHVLIIGWGRIAKHLAYILQSCHADVTILSRDTAHRSEITSFGMRALSPDDLPLFHDTYHIIFNTAPSAVLPATYYHTQKGTLMIDLASDPGIPRELSISARGLPGLLAPESSGELIAQTILHRLKEDSL